MFDIPKAPLLRFGNGNLRELVARLCDAELNRAEAPVSAMLFGVEREHLVP